MRPRAPHIPRAALMRSNSTEQQANSSRDDCRIDQPSSQSRPPARRCIFSLLQRLAVRSHPVEQFLVLLNYRRRQRSIVQCARHLLSVTTHNILNEVF